MNRLQTVALVRDLFFRSKLDAVARNSAGELAYASTLAQARAKCAELAPALIIVDLSDQAFPAAATARIVAEAAPGAKLVGFASHVDLRALSSAREAGFQLTLSRQEFAARLPELLQAPAGPPSS